MDVHQVMSNKIAICRYRPRYSSVLVAPGSMALDPLAEPLGSVDVKCQYSPHNT